LFISDTMPNEVENLQLLDAEQFDFKTFYKNLSKGSSAHYVLLTEHPKNVYKNVKECCQFIKAAGGLVKNANGEYLFIFRNKRWDLPKGKVEKGEKMKEAALREVEEECGVTIFKNKNKLCRTFHVYEMNNGVVLKKTNWYNMTVKGSPKLIPQKEEGITKAVWLKSNALNPVLKNTYPLILEVLKSGDLL
jgi:hypothetical protein